MVLYGILYRALRLKERFALRKWPKELLEKYWVVCFYCSRIYFLLCSVMVLTFNGWERIHQVTPLSQAAFPGAVWSWFQASWSSHAMENSFCTSEGQGGLVSIHLQKLHGKLPPYVICCLCPTMVQDRELWRLLPLKRAIHGICNNLGKLSVYAETSISCSKGK